MGKIEKTLELNITHEILSLADSFWWFLQSTSINEYWKPHWRFPFIGTPKSFATGLHINLEGKEGGGYDVCINSPSNFQDESPRLLFMQFKAGVEKPFNTNTKSEFYGNSENKSIHVEFDINSNKKKNQHRLLKELATKSGNKDAVVYVFPRIVNNNQLENNIGRLLRKTSFISISELDDKAKKNNVTIDDGTAHKFRTCYNDYHKNEVNYYYYYFGKPENPGGLLGEIFSIRIYRALVQLKTNQVKNYPISKYLIIDAMIKYVLNIGLHFSISINSIEAILKEFSRISNRFNHLNEFEDLSYNYKIEGNEANIFEEEIFNDIIKSISKYFLWIEQVSHFENEDIPKPPSKYTIDLNKDGIRFEVENQDDNIENITYALI